MYNQKGLLHLALPLLILLIIGVAAYALVYFKVIKNPLEYLPFFNPSKQVPEISTKTEYKNPFKKETQYVNPFDTYKNPFVVSK